MAIIKCKRRILVTLSHAGEKCFAHSPREYLGTLAAGAGAGLITAFTVLAKAAIASRVPPSALQSGLIFLDYALSFLMMQMLGFRLATKQPALLAAALLRKGGSNQHPVRGALNAVRAVCRSQIAATAGNFAAVLVTAFGVDRASLALTGAHPLSEHEAHLAFSTLDLLSWKMLSAAALTGVVLWFASLVGAWLSRRPRAASRSERSRYSSAGCSVALAALLAYVPALGRVTGLPINVCHFTLSSGWLAFSVLRLGSHQAIALGLLRATLAISAVGILNFGMAFLSSLLSLAVAHPERARGLRRVLKPAARAFARAPGSFLLPLLPPIEPSEA